MARTMHSANEWKNIRNEETLEYEEEEVDEECPQQDLLDSLDEDKVNIVIAIPHWVSHEDPLVSKFEDAVDMLIKNLNIALEKQRKEREDEDG